MAELSPVSMKNPDLLPTKEEDRKMSLMDYIFLWAGMTINIVGFSLGAQYYNAGEGLSALSLIAVVVIGYGFVTIMTAMAGDIGTLYGVPFAAYARAPFGYKGSYVAATLRAIPGLYWFGFLTWVGASSLNYILGLFTDFDNLTLMIIVFGALQILNAMYGLKAMAKFDWLAVPALAILFASIMIAITTKFGVSIPDIIATPAEGKMSFAYAVSGIAGGWITMAINGPDLSRQIKRDPNYASEGFFKRNKRAFIGQLIGLIGVGALLMLIGMAAGIVTGEWDLNKVCIMMFGENTWGLLMAFVAIAFAQWSTNTAANLMPPAYSLIAIFPKLRFWSATIIAGIIGLAIMPWKIQSSSTFLVDVQVWISTMLGPIIGIVLADYFIIRKCKLNVHDLYTTGGQYRYTRGFNMSAMTALVLSFALSFTSKNYGFFVGMAAAPVVYVTMMKAFTLKHYNQDIGRVVELDMNELS